MDMAEAETALESAIFKEWQREAEVAEVGFNWAEYGEYAGIKLPGDEANKAKFAEMQEALYRSLVDGHFIPLDEIPRELRTVAIERANRSENSRLQSNILEAKGKKVVSAAHKYNGDPVSINTWRQFNARHISDRDTRRTLFHELCEKSLEILSPLVEQYFKTAIASFRPHATTPSRAFAERAGIPLERVRELVERSGEAARNPYFEFAERMWPELFGADFDPDDPIDDYYALRSVRGKGLDEAFGGIRPIDVFHRVMEDMGIVTFPRHVAIDDRERKGKAPSPFCQPIQVPTIIKLIYKQDPQDPRPYEVLEVGLHESGHGAHFASISPDLPFYERADAFIHPSKAEIYSTLFESLITNHHFLEELGIKAEHFDTILERDRLAELAFLSLYTPLCLLKMDVFDGSLSVNQAAKKFEELTAQYGVRLPAGYLVQHHVWSGHSFVYEPSYLLAKIRSADLRASLEEEFGEDWYKSPEAGSYLMNDVFGPGNRTDVNKFSSLDSKRYFREIGIEQ